MNLANPLEMLHSFSPIFSPLKCLKPKNTSRENVQKVGEIRDALNQTIHIKNWTFHWIFGHSTYFTPFCKKHKESTQPRKSGIESDILRFSLGKPPKPRYCCSKHILRRRFGWQPIYSENPRNCFKVGPELRYYGLK